MTRFVEKPKEEAVLDALKLTREMSSRLGFPGDREMFLASMGIYLINRSAIRGLLDQPLSDFGEHIFPRAVGTQRLSCYVYHGYWADIGTISSFFNANLELIGELTRFNLFDMNRPIFSRPRYLPGAKVNGAEIDHAIIADGCIINRARIHHSIVGLRTIVGEGTELNRVVSFGKDYYESQSSVVEHERQGLPRLGVGAHCKIENTIIDKNARIGNHVTISPAGKPASLDADRFYIREGIVIIPKNAIIPHGTVI